MMRAIAAAEVVVLGVTGLVLGGLSGVDNVLRAIGRATGAVLPSGETVSYVTSAGDTWLVDYQPESWFGSWVNAVVLLRRSPEAMLLLDLLLLLGVGLVAGYVARRRGWAFGLMSGAVPWLWVWASEGPDLVATAVLGIGAVTAGGYLGSRICQANETWWVPMIAGCTAGLAAVIGYVDAALHSGLGRTVVVLSALAVATIGAALVVEVVARYWERKSASMVSA
jgi:hypothetical protein